MRLKGKRVFITAAGQGIGRSSAEACLREGAEVFATDGNADLLAGLDCETARLDVLDAAAVTETVGRAKADVLFNCAGYRPQRHDPGGDGTRTGTSPST